MTRHVHTYRLFVVVLLSITTLSCSSMWINKSGHLSAIISEVDESELHDVYTLMRASGYLMKKPRVIELSDTEVWEEHAWGKDGKFEDPGLPLFQIYCQFLKQEKRIRVSINEFYNKGGGFSSEGLLRADHIMNLFKQRFGGSVKVVVRSYYTGSH